MILETGQEWLDRVWDSMKIKMKAQCLRVGTDIPFFPYAGRYRDCIMPDGISWWTNGFWPGMLWQMYHATKEDCYCQAAQGVELRLEEALREFDRLHHDVGFMFQLSAVADWQVTQSRDSLRRGLHAATLLAGRFNPTGNYLRAWNESQWKEDVSGWMIIDSLLNLPLLYWAGKVTGDPRFSDIATRHASTALHTLLRPDGSCNHIAEFDPVTGEFRKGVGGQGYGEGSSWSRGQSWAVYGFALAYRETGDERFLHAAKNCAHYCIANLALTDWLPLVDFRAPETPVKYDSGAAVIIACGLLELEKHLPELERPLYHRAAEKMLRACEARFADWDPDSDGILGGGTTMYHDDRLANMSFIYGDYFFLEAILRLRGEDLPIW